MNIRCYNLHVAYTPIVKKVLYVALLILALSAPQAIAQQGSPIPFSGTVVDAATQDPLPGATIVIKGTSTGVITDLDGAFTLSVPNEEATLVFSYVGYVTQEIKVGSRTALTVALSENASELGEVVVTALGVESNKAELSYATQTIPTQEINASRTGDLSRQLRGMVPGLTVTTNGGSGVSSSRIILRGESSLDIGNNEPLIILDGVPISNNFNGIEGGNSRSNQPIDYGNGLTDINPDDIADISVLKGPKAAALYGTRAANGALVIRTRSGEEKEGLGIVYTTGIAFDLVTRYWDVQNSYSGGNYGGQLDTFIYQNYGGWGLPLDGRLQPQPYIDRGVVPDPTPLVSRFTAKDFFETGFSQNHHLSFSYSAEDVVTGRLSLSLQDKNGIVPNTGYERKGLSTRIRINLFDPFTLDLSLNYVNSRSDNVPVMGVGDDGREGLAYALVWTPNNISMDEYRNNYWYFNKDGVRTQRSIPAWITNPQIIAHENLNSFDRNRLFGNVKATYRFNDRVYAFVRVGMDQYDDFRTSRRPQGQTYFPNGMYREQDVKFTEINADFLVSYEAARKSNVGFNAQLGGNIMRQESSSSQTRTSQLSILDVYNFANALDQPQFNQVNVKKQINSLYASVQLDYQKKVFLDITGRNDWSSTLIQSNNSFFYPSVGLSGILTDIFNLPKAISFWQLRASWAQTGNDTAPQLINRAFAYGQLPGSATLQSRVVDPELKPEQTTAIEVGVDIRFLDDRLKLEANYYSNSTKDQILRASISPASGATVKLLNAGLIRNRGLEVLLQGTPVRNEKIRWDLAANWSTNRGEIVELAEGINSFIIARGPTLPGVIIQAVPGGRMGDMYGKDYKRHEGQIIWKEVDGIATFEYDNQLRKVGNYNPDWILGFTSNFRYKGITLRVIGEYRHGGELYTETGSRLIQSGKDSDTMERATVSEVIPEGVMLDSDGSYVPNTITQPYFNYVRRSRHWENAALNTFDASFFKLREVSIGTDLVRYIKNVPFTQLSVSVFARNLFTYTLSHELRHFDPESFMINQGNLVPGVESGQLPTPITLGFNVSIGI